MPRDKFKPKDFESYRKDEESYVPYEKRMERLERGRPDAEEGEFLRSEKDVKRDYFSDEAREKEDRGEIKTRKSRPLKAPKRMISKWDTRKAKRRNRREYGR